MILLNECKHGWLYRLSSRNLVSGVYNETVKAFVGIREKFGHEYLDTEYHWDNGPPFGTAKPLEILMTCPYEPVEFFDNFQNNINLFNWLKECTI